MLTVPESKVSVPFTVVSSKPVKDPPIVTPPELTKLPPLYVIPPKPTQKVSYTFVIVKEPYISSDEVPELIKNPAVDDDSPRAVPLNLALEALYPEVTTVLAP
jgi:hypothetical protein